MQISRLFQIGSIILEKGAVTAQELAKRFEVSIRSFRIIYRDIETLAKENSHLRKSRQRRRNLSF